MTSIEPLLLTLDVSFPETIQNIPLPQEERQKLFSLNLDPLTEYIQDFYSKGGRPDKHQAQILRSLILFVLLFNKTKARHSLTYWVMGVLPNAISLTVLIGCASFDELPTLGSYFDFMNRFWLEPREVYSCSSLLPAGKNGKTLKVNWFRWQAPRTGGTLQKIFSILVVFSSIRLGLIEASNLTLSGDGTSVVSHVSTFGRHLPSSSADYRHYSDPDAKWGWNSNNETWYFGYRYLP